MMVLFYGSNKVVEGQIARETENNHWSFNRAGDKQELMGTLGQIRRNGADRMMVLADFGKMMATVEGLAEVLGQMNSAGMTELVKVTQFRAIIDQASERDHVARYAERCLGNSSFRWVSRASKPEAGFLRELKSAMEFGGGARERAGK